MAAMAAAAAVWAAQLWPAAEFDAGQFQNLQPIETDVLTVRPGHGVLRVQCRITNRGSQVAQQVVLAARIRDRQGNVIGVNPLASVSDLPPQATREAEILIPSDTRVAQYTAEVESTLVRWQE